MEANYYDGEGTKERKVELTLSHLLDKEATEEDYDFMIEKLGCLLVKTFNDYKFLIAKSSDETNSYHFMQVVSLYTENPHLHREIFVEGIKRGIDMPTLQKKFVEKLAKGDILSLGEGIKILTDDGTNSIPSGVSPINSGIEGGEIAFNIAFLKEENYGKWVEKNFSQEGNEGE
ncbi:hypothetical protein BH753_gp095 [Bacillus phage Shbh1]|uniref:Putative membrane protein n=1 Tax=Bacillus phage Shbh1 TaxID=1796992 RepID=A0A142F1C0_9CAUD|nr:hypothetical protein BH753_gp095 [Bacillus phage Shbh1]AMQ66577.1 putative membrane protein [Bacillus phage Shbh1]